MTAPKTTKVAAVTQTPLQVLQAAGEAFIAACEAFQASDNATVHAVNVGDYRIRFTGAELLSFSRT
jgi:hypothetical protein